MEPRIRRLLTALRTKYRTLRALRTAAATPPKDELRAQLAALAQAFPGALRELDQLPLACIEARLSAIDRALEEDAPEIWMTLQIGYHGFMRAVLRIRRQTRQHATASELTAAVALTYTPAEDEPPAARFDRAALEIIRNPPAGRLNPWVLAEVAKDHGVTPAMVQESLFLR
jgi:hypothetical protein